MGLQCYCQSNVQTDYIQTTNDRLGYMFCKNDPPTADERNFFPHTGIHQGLMRLENQVYNKLIAAIAVVISGQVKHSHTLLRQFNEIRIHWNTNTCDSIRVAASQSVVTFLVPTIQHNHPR